MFEHLFYWAYGYFRPILKWFLRKFTRLCELQRICYGGEEGAPRTLGIEYSLRMSKQPRIKKIITTLGTKLHMMDTDELRLLVVSCLDIIIETKKINSRSHPDLGYTLKKCIESIFGYQNLYHTIENLRVTNFDSNNMIHERKLYDLWDFLNPSDKLESRITKKWQEIGFQV